LIVDVLDLLIIPIDASFVNIIFVKVVHENILKNWKINLSDEEFVEWINKQNPFPTVRETWRHQQKKIDELERDTLRTGVCRSDKGAAMSKLEEIEKFRNLYPEICEKDGLWQTAPKHYFDDQILIAIRSIDHLLSLVKQTEIERERLSKLLIEERMKVVGYRDMKQAISDTLYEHNEFFTDAGKIILKLLDKPEGRKEKV